MICSFQRQKFLALSLVFCVGFSTRFALHSSRLFRETEGVSTGAAFAHHLWSLLQKWTDESDMWNVEFLANSGELWLCPEVAGIVFSNPVILHRTKLV